MIHDLPYFRDLMESAMQTLCNEDQRFAITQPGRDYDLAIKFLQSEVEARVQPPETNLTGYAYWIRYSSDRTNGTQLEDFVRDLVATDKLYEKPEILARLNEHLETFQRAFPKKMHMRNSGIIRVDISYDYFSKEPEKEEVIDSIINYLLLPIGVIDLSFKNN